MTCGVKTDFILVYTALCQYFFICPSGFRYRFAIILNGEQIRITANSWDSINNR